MPFWVSPVNPNTTPGFEQMLLPAPTIVVYPEGKFGEEIPTPDGRVIVQQPPQDSRVRQWVWQRFQGTMVVYEAQFHLLEQLRSRYRQERGLSPYVWLKENATKKLRIQVSTNLTATGSGNGAATLQFAPTPSFTVNGLTDGAVEILPSSIGGTGTGNYQRRNIVSNTSDTITVSPAWGTIPNGAQAWLQYWKDDWVRARVLEVDRAVSQESGGRIKYDTTRVSFVVEDSAWNFLG